MKRLLIVTGWCFAIASTWASPVAAADQFARRFALELESGAAYYSVTLPAAIYSASQRDDLGDVRVFNGAGEPVPYALDTPREPARTRPTLRPVAWFPVPPAAHGGPGAPLGVTIAPDGSLRATAAPPESTQHDTDLVDIGHVAGGAPRVDALLVHVRDDNYQGRVTVESSEDLRSWQPAGDAQLLKVTYNGSTLTQDRIALDGRRARYVRLHWLDGAPFIDSIDMEVLAVNAEHAQRADIERQWREGIVAHAGPKAGEYFFATGGAYPVDRLRLNLPQPNTVAPAVVYSRTGLESPWREVANATLFRLHNGAVEQSNPSLELAADTDRQWRVVVDMSNGGLGSGTLTVAAGWRPATLTFVARGTAPFTLAVGDGQTVSSAVSRADLLMGASAVVAAARLGEALSDAPPDGDAQASNKDLDARRRYLLWAALLLAVGSLGAIAWRLARGTQAQSGVKAGSVAGGSGAASAAATTVIGDTRTPGAEGQSNGEGGGGGESGGKG